MNLFTIAKVAVENTAYSFDKLFDYSVPDFLISSINPGARVFVPFGNGSKKRIGMVFSVRKEKEISQKLKNISGVLDLEPLLTEEMLLSANFVREQTFCTYFDACKQFLPIGYSTKISVSYAADPDYSGAFSDETEKSVYEFLLDKNRFLKEETVIKECKLQKCADILDKMFVSGMLLRNTESKRKVNDAVLKMARLAELEDDTATVKLTKKQENVIKVLEEFQTLSVKELCYYAGVSATVVTGLEAKGVIEIYDHEVYRSVKMQTEGKNNNEIVLSEEQNMAFDGLKILY
ncbi:MAG: primosomal protein N', partial [Oscillospiraceae bacterium]|nr:primosomal protein N' [Oscillospiraceae bacterium]